MIDNIQTPEQIARHYFASLDSVNLINELLAKPTLTETESKVVERNVEHLRIMVGKDFWTVEDLTPLQNAINAGSSES
jgi:hypothetical protein